MKKRWVHVFSILSVSIFCTACGGAAAQTSSLSSQEIESSFISEANEDVSAASGAASQPNIEAISSLLQSRYIGNGMEIVPIPDIKTTVRSTPRG